MCYGLLNFFPNSSKAKWSGQLMVVYKVIVSILVVLTYCLCGCVFVFVLTTVTVIVFSLYCLELSCVLFC